MTQWAAIRAMPWVGVAGEALAYWVGPVASSHSPSPHLANAPAATERRSRSLNPAHISWPVNEHSAGLSAEVEQFVDQLLAGRDHPTIAAVLSAGEHQADKVLADVRIAELQRTAHDGSNAVFARSPLNRQTGIDARGIQIQPTAFETAGVRKTSEL